jgi:uncharacterized repeat protein (TIGR03803 family)
MKMLRMSCVFVGFMSLVLSLSAQTFTTLYSFGSMTNEGNYLLGGLVQATDGNFYGTTQEGGANPSCDGGTGCGTVFKLTPSGTLTTLHSFCSQAGCPDGEFPYSGLVQATDGNFYGTTYEGGTNNGGTIFKITPSGTLTTLYSFCSQGRSICPDGQGPIGGLIQGSNGSLYGTTWVGGLSSCAYLCGTVFKITTAGALTTLYSFTGFADGGKPAAGLVQGSNGNFYGTTNAGGANGFGGTVFEITPNGTLTTLHSFDGTDGSAPAAALVQAANGSLYGTTSNGGGGTLGTIFKMTPAGALTTLYSFCLQSGCPDGELPSGGMVQATDGNLYGTTYEGGINESGTVFKITPAGALTTLYLFCSLSNCADGQNSHGGLIQDTNGNLYGTTQIGGADGAGSVFSLSVGLAPFVETQPTAGRVGAVVKILGQGFTGTTGVSFNGKAATFKVWSKTYLTATVPSGATTGFVTVLTPADTLKSNKQFHVTPQITSFNPPSAAVGSQVTITGVSLAQTTKVIFGGVKATTFTVNSDTQVTATVPTGALTGKITIATAGGTATSAATFTVTP